MNLKRAAIIGVKWTTLNKAITVFLGLLKISILARFLDKSDFGVIALVLFFLELLTLFMDMGITIAILHKRRITRTQYASLFWLNIGLSILLYFLLFWLSPTLSNFYNEPLLRRIIPILGLNVIFSAIGIQYKTIERKRLEFKFISIVEVVSSFGSFLSAIILVLLDFGVYSLVYSLLVQAFLANIIFLFLAIKSRLIQLHFRLSETIPFIRIGVYYLGGEVINFFNRNIDLILIGKIFGTEILGGYSLAKQLVEKPFGIINPILTTVSAPLLSKFQQDLKQLSKAYLSLVNVISTINTPIYLIIIIFASQIVRLLYGPNYQEIVMLVRILSVFMLLRSIYNPNSSLVIATGRTKLGFFWNLMTLPFVPIAIIIASKYGIVCVAVVLTIVTMIIVLPGMWYFLIYKMCGASLKDYLTSLVPKFGNIVEYINYYIKNRKVNL